MSGGEVQAICEKYGLPYNSGRFSKQIGSVWGKIFRLAVPWGAKQDPTPAVTVIPERVPVAV